MSFRSFGPRARRMAVRGLRVGAGITTIYCGFSLWTRHCHFEPFEPPNDKLFEHPILEKINPFHKPDSHDCCVRIVPFKQVQPALLQSARTGGTALIEAFARGMWGGYGFAIQRGILSLTRDGGNPDLWTKADLQTSAFEPGTYFTNWFHVLSKSPHHITLRGCFKPRQDPPTPQSTDSLGQLEVWIDESKSIVHFKFKSVTFDGTEAAADVEDPFGGISGWLHKQYAKLLVEAGVGNCCDGELKCKQDPARKQVTAEQASIWRRKERVHVADGLTPLCVAQMTAQRASLERVASAGELAHV
ncbi:hypothetical protein NM208_g16184 [Fusarium decemcellulare]|uniref:Uncharacterized protein n=1 Tax=Fusarium decemcellulare TaxID=57161 RepID=A0ACC1RCB0_9HYPO|nr:hypothetical protein NM208_g16184 [Fusarium decemcellulare]